MWPFNRNTQEPAEKRDVTEFLTFEDVFPTDGNTYAGPDVSYDTAMDIPAVFRSVSLNAQTIASFPVDAMAKSGEARHEVAKPSWLIRPNAEYTWSQFIQEIVTSLELDGNAFILKVSADNGRVVDLWHLSPRMVDVERANLPGNPIVYRIHANDGDRILPSNAVIHIKAMTMPRALRGLSPITSCLYQTLGSAAAMEEFAARFFGSGANLSGIIEVPTDLPDELAEKLKEMFTLKHGGVKKSHAVGILYGGAHWVPMSVNPEEAQFLQSRKFTDTQIANIFGVPAWLVTDAEGAKGYITGVQASNQMWYQTGLLWRVMRLEEAFSDILPRGQYIKFNLKNFLRVDAEKESANLATAWEHGVINADQWRAYLDLDPLPDGKGQVYYVPLNFGKAGESALEGEVVDDSQPKQLMSGSGVQIEQKNSRQTLGFEIPLTIENHIDNIALPDITLAAPVEARKKTITEFVTDPTTGRITGKIEREE